MSFTLGSGRPTTAAVINTKPKQLRFFFKFDQVYKLRLVYVPIPTQITSVTQTLYIQDEFHEGLYLKFVAKIAEAIGDDALAETYEARYQRWLSENKWIAKNTSKKHVRLRFSWI